VIEEIFILLIRTSYDFYNRKSDISEGTFNEKSIKFSHNICVAKEEEHCVEWEKEERNHPNRKEDSY